jgi:hypothetical protein
MRFTITPALAVAGAMLFAMTVAEAQPTIPSKFTITGASASASFEVSEDSCIVRGSFLTARDDDDDSPTSTLYLVAYEDDRCQDISLHYYEIRLLDLSPTAFTISNNGRTATLNTSLTFFDWVVEEHCSGSVNLTWTATGPAEPSNFVFRSRSPDSAVTIVSRGVGRPATAMGSIIGCDKDHYASETSLSADVLTLSETVITRTRAP